MPKLDDSGNVPNCFGHVPDVAEQIRLHADAEAEGRRASIGLRRRLRRPMLARTLFVTLTNSIRQNSSPGHPCSLPNFKWPVLGCIDAKFCDQILIEKRLTRSTNSTFSSRSQFSIFCKNVGFVLKNCRTIRKKIVKF